MVEALVNLTVPIFKQACVNFNEGCSGWAREGMCDTKPDYMLQSCKLACNVCQADGHSGAWLEGVFINTAMNLVIPVAIVYSLATMRRKVFWPRVVATWILIAQVGVSMGYHRYFTHHTYETSAAGMWVLGSLGMLSMQGTPMFWGAQHLLHHENCETEDDPHSPIQLGLMHAHGGFLQGSGKKTVDHSDGFHILSNKMRAHPVNGVLHNNEMPHILAMWLGVPLVSYTLFGFHSTLWYLHVPQVIAWHSTLSVNSIMHWFGYARPGDETAFCQARNVPWMWSISMGEAWHSNHHAASFSASFEGQWWEFDPVYRLILLSERLGLVWNVKHKDPERVADFHGAPCLVQMVAPASMVLALAIRYGRRSLQKNKLN